MSSSSCFTRLTRCRPRIEREKQSCQQIGVRYKAFPLPNRGDNFLAVEELAAYLKNTREKVYVHGFKLDDRAKMLDGVLRHGMVAWRDGNLTAVETVNYNVLLGPEPDSRLEGELHKWGVTNREKLDLKGNENPVSIANQLELTLAGHKGVFYFSGFASLQQRTQVAKILRGRYYGLAADALAGDFAGGRVEKISNRLLTGPLPTEAEVRTIGNTGVKTLVLLTGRGNISLENHQALADWAKTAGLRFTTIAFGNGYEDAIIRLISQDNNPCYLAVESAAKTQVVTDLRAAKLY
ncbi:MAG TPA: hypothetical protein VHS59_06600 [Bacillota bacterium]|nr:hypothetical protein [Bacillota bacterium]